MGQAQIARLLVGAVEEGPDSVAKTPGSRCPRLADPPDCQQQVGPWFMAGTPLNCILDLDFWRQQNLMILTDRYLLLSQRT